VGSPHVRVGHRQALKYTNPKQKLCLGFCALGHWDFQGDYRISLDFAQIVMARSLV
jgi:hypothetical protein